MVRTAAHITGMVTEARLPDRVQRRALAAFDALAVAEGRLHRRPPESVHFHEVGGIDAIIDVVGTCAALEVLGIDEVDASAVANGTGMVRAAHGLLPVPAPAVVELLRGAPTYQLDIPLELTTPTGAALLAATVTQWGPMPALTIDRTGFGAGSAESGRAAQPDPGGHRHPGRRPDRRDSRWCWSRSTWTTPPARRWPMRWPPCSRPGPTTPGSPPS